MKKILGVVLVIVVAYSGFWYYEANKGKTYIEQKMNEANIHSDKISLSGYPCTYDVTIENPVWVRENVSVALQGKVHIATNILGNKFWVSRNGEIHAKLDGISEIESFILKGENQVFLEVRDSYFLNHPFQSLPMAFSDEDDLVIYHKLKEVAISGKDFNIQITDNNGTSTIDIGSLDLKWKNSLNDKSQTHQIDFNITDYAANLSSSEKSDQTFPDFIQAIASTTKSQKMSFVGEFTIPKEDFNLMTFPEMSWNISSFDSSSPLGKGHSNASFSVVKKDGQHVEITFDLNSDSTIFEKPFQDKMNELFTSLKNPAKAHFPEAEKLREMLKEHESEVRAVVPNFPALSPLRMKINLKALFHALTPATENGEIDIDSFNVTMAPYSFLSGGKFKLESNQFEGAYKIKVVNYKKMIDDMVSYTNNLYKVLTKIYDRPEIFDFQITPKMHEDILKFLAEISDEPKKENQDLHITVKVQKDGSVFIGSLEAMQAAAKWDSLFKVHEEKKP